MSKGQLTSNPIAMDVRLQQNSQLHFGINGGPHRDAKARGDNSEQVLSQDERECLLFFDKTIVSLEESLEDEGERRPKSAGVQRSRAAAAAVSDRVDGMPSYTPPPSVLSPSPGPTQRHGPGHKDQDIIDLVQPGPDVLQNRVAHIDPPKTDFQSLRATADAHFENKPRRESTNSLPSEYNPPLPGNFHGSADVHYHPPGCIPTPVLIAHQIAEHRGGGSSGLHPSSLLRHRSLDGERPPGFAEHSVRQGPPTSAKPSRFPSNINVVVGNKEHQNQSNVNIHERQAQMLANLTGTSHPLEQQHLHQDTFTKAERILPTRSISFRDPTPDKSRTEALSKLGLNRSRAMSGDMSVCVTPGVSSPPRMPTAPSVRTPNPSQAKRPESSSASGGRDKPFQMNLSPLAATTRSTFHQSSTPRQSNPVTPPAEFTSLDFNSYGGRSVVVNPSAGAYGEPVAAPPSAVPPALEGPTDFNSYGGKSKVMTPARSDLPDILSSHIDRSAAAQTEAVPAEHNSYGVRSRTITPLKSVSHSTPRTPKSPPPSTAPKPARHHSLVNPQQKGGLARPPSPPEPRRKSSVSKVPAFRSQGITVQFSGRGATDESRRDALRKLGLLKDEC